jgi:hypothetical protein
MLWRGIAPAAAHDNKNPDPETHHEA